MTRAKLTPHRRKEAEKLAQAFSDAAINGEVPPTTMPSEVSGLAALVIELQDEIEELRNQVDEFASSVAVH